jgi:hypothetical protein
MASVAFAAGPSAHGESVADHPRCNCPPYSRKYAASKHLERGPFAYPLLRISMQHHNMWIAEVQQRGARAAILAR